MRIKFKNFGLLEFVVSLSLFYVVLMLIWTASTRSSVTTADPEIVSGTARAIREISEDVGILCGAGVKNGQDVLKAIELGTSGVLLASGVTKVKDAVAALNDLVSEL